MNWLLMLCIAMIPVGTRIFLGSVIPGVHEYESILLYGSDIFIIGLIVTTFLFKKEAIKSLLREKKAAFLFVFILAALVSAWLAPSLTLGVYSVIRLTLIVLFAYAIGTIASPAAVFRGVLVVIGVVSVLQGIIGILQFSNQESIGLQLFGEPGLVSYAGSASTIAVADARILRAYGTFPHPNIYGGFLVLGLLSLSYLYLWCEERLKKDIFNHPQSWWNFRHGILALRSYMRHPYFYWRMLIAASAFLVVVGLTLSFSRSAWIAAVVGLVVFCATALRTKIGGGAILRLVLMLLVCVVICYQLLAPMIVPRARLTGSEPAVSERFIYGRIGLDLVMNVVGGVGVGNQVLYSVEHKLYQNYGLPHPWSWEPIHNLYLLVGAELGWLGLLSFLAFLGMIAFGEHSRKLWRSPSLEWAVAIGLFFALLVAGLFDHYLWTIQSGKLMLWLVIGLCLSRLATTDKR